MQLLTRCVHVLRAMHMQIAHRQRAVRRKSVSVFRQWQPRCVAAEVLTALSAALADGLTEPVARLCTCRYPYSLCVWQRHVSPSSQALAAVRPRCVVQAVSVLGVAQHRYRHAWFQMRSA